MQLLHMFPACMACSCRKRLPLPRSAPLLGCSQHAFTLVPQTRPLMHALLEPGIAGARGIEIDRIKCDKAAAFLKQVCGRPGNLGSLPVSAGTTACPP